MVTARTKEQSRIEIYDTTLRDGTQGYGVNLSLVDKLNITHYLDLLGVDFIEGGYPLSNPKDVAYFQQARDLNLKHAKVCAFGMTRRANASADEDAGLAAMIASHADVLTIVGKSWDLHADQVLRVSLDENLAMIRDSVMFCRVAGYDVFYDAEHFFDGYKENPDYALATLRAAYEANATRLILCDTNGGSLPGYIVKVVNAVRQALGVNVGLGIHPHNDAGLAVANALAGIEAGCIQAQGTINGVGERCGNVDLTTLVPNLRLKMGYDCLLHDSLPRLTETSRFVYETANLNPQPNQPYVGSAAYAHKGGMHVHAVRRVTRTYEHVAPNLIGNTRRVLISELSGASNIAATIGKKFDILDDKSVHRKLAERVQALEHQGYQFEVALASFELLVHDILGTRQPYWTLDHYRCVILKTLEDVPLTEVTVKLKVNGQVEHRVAEGDGPVNALDAALRQCLVPHYPKLAHVHLRDYKVRVVNPTAESAAKVRVIVEFAVTQDGDSVSSDFTTVGVNENIVDASWQALSDAFEYHLIESQVVPSTDSEGGARTVRSPRHGIPIKAGGALSENA